MSTGSTMGDPAPGEGNPADGAAAGEGKPAGRAVAMANVPVVEVAQVRLLWDPTIHAESDIPAGEWRGPLSAKCARAIINTEDRVAIGVFHPCQTLGGSYNYYLDRVFEHKGERMYKYLQEPFWDTCIVAREVIGEIVLEVDMNHADGGSCTIVTKFAMTGLVVGKFSLKPNCSMRVAKARHESRDILIGMGKATSQTKVTLVMGCVALSGRKVLKAPTLKRGILALPAHDAKKPKV